jgi:hypothetical protein
LTVCGLHPIVGLDEESSQHGHQTATKTQSAGLADFHDES